MSASARTVAQTVSAEHPVVGTVFGPWSFGSLDVAPLRAVARRAVAHRRTTWAKTAALRDVVRARYPLGFTCDFLATAMWRLGRELGLPLRIAVGSANVYTWAWDSHTTVEVWLANEKRWAISDPTFSGWFTLGRAGRRLGSVDVNRLLAAGQRERIFWHAALRTKNASLSSDSWLDPREYFRSIGILAGSNRTWGFLVPHAAGAVVERPLLVTRADLGRTRGAITARPVVRPPLPPLRDPPRETLAWRGQVWSAAPGSESSLPVARRGSAYVVSTAPIAVAGFSSAPAGDGRYVTPVFALPGGAIKATFYNAGAAVVDVSVYVAPVFPRTREIVSPRGY